MSAVVYQLSAYMHRQGRARASDTGIAVTAIKPEKREAEFCFWQGASGHRYVHHVFSLIECPQLPISSYALVLREASGRRVLLDTGAAEHNADSLNLAEVRHRGAILGANEVHVHLLAQDAAERAFVAADVLSGPLASQHPLSA